MSVGGVAFRPGVGLAVVGLTVVGLAVVGLAAVGLAAGAESQQTPPPQPQFHRYSCLPLGALGYPEGQILSRHLGVVLMYLAVSKALPPPLPVNMGMLPAGRGMPAAAAAA